jgi:hypothetical protein
MPDTDALIERLFPVTTSEILRDPAASDFSFVMPSKVSQPWTFSLIYTPIPAYLSALT